MTEIEITPLEEARYGVAVIEGTTTTHHRVTVPDDLLTDLGLGGTDPEVAIRESFEFLLEREPASSILPQFSLDEISRYFPEYRDELRVRLVQRG
ncbi:MAG: hypothetical protein ACRDI0_00720 [Actinomycetota bacterium]